jgi:hypothetical protein
MTANASSPTSWPGRNVVRRVEVARIDAAAPDEAVERDNPVIDDRQRRRIIAARSRSCSVSLPGGEQQKMPRAPNYNQARGDRNRAKEQKKQERLRRREEDALRRKATRSESTVGADPEDPPAPTSSPTVIE